MSLSSYRQNVRRGVTGKNTSTCFPAALEKISPDHRLPPKVYEEYQEFVKWHDSLDGIGHLQATEIHSKTLTNIVEHLGSFCSDQLIYRNITRRYRLRETLTKLTSQDFRVLVELQLDEGRHAVGIIPTGVEDAYRLTSTWVPHSLQGIITPENIYPLLARPEDVLVPATLHHVDHPLNSANLIAIPPV